MNRSAVTGTVTNGRFATAALLAPLVVALVDVAAARFVGGPVPNGTRGYATVAVSTAGSAALFGIALAIFFFAVARIVPATAHFRLPLPRRPVLSLRRIVGQLSVAAALTALNWGLFEGAGISKTKNRDLYETIFRIVVVVVAAIGMATVFALRERLIVASRRLRRASGLIALAGAAAVLFAHALNRFQGNPAYSLQELQIAAAGLTLTALGLELLLVGVRRAVLIALWVGASALVLVDIGLRAGSSYAAMRAPMMRARAVSHWSPYTDRAFRMVVKPHRARSEDVADLMARLAGADALAVERELARILPDRSKLNVLLVAVDTLRADHTSLYGYGRPTTPRIVELSKDAFVFRRAYTPFPTSGYAYSSTFHSLPPRLTPAYSEAYSKKWTFADESALASLLARSGRKTGAVTAFNPQTADDPKWFGHLKTGFDVYNPRPSLAGFTAAEVVDRGLAFVDSVGPSPWFLWTHVMEPHAPYVAQPGFDFGETLIDRYDGEIAYSDAQVGRLIDGLKSRDLLDRTIVVLFSDHGEEFGEHGSNFHNTNVYEQQTRIPLVVRVPGLRGRSVDSAVGLMDVLPTLSALLGIDDKVPRFGRSVVLEMLGTDAVPGGFAFSEWFEVRMGSHVKDIYGVVAGAKKLVVRPQQETVELYDIDADPLERNSLAGTGDGAESRLRGMFDAFTARFGKSGAAPSAGVEDLEKSIESKLGAFVSGRTPISEVMNDLRPRLFTGYWEPSPAAKRRLGDDGHRRVLTLIRDAAESKANGAHQLLRLLCYSRDPAFADFWRGLLREKRSSNIATEALSLLGEPIDTDAVAEALTVDRIGERQDLANCLARAGDRRCADWFTANVLAQKYGRQMLQGIEALPKICGALGVTASSFLRDRVFEEDYRHPEVNLAILAAVESETDENADLIVLRMCRSEQEEVRSAALAIARRRLGAAAVDKNLVAVDHELAADLAAVYGSKQWSEAVGHLRRSLELGTCKNTFARFRLARALFGSGDAVGARRTLDEVAGDPAVAASDRALARRLGSIETPHPDFADLKPTIEFVGGFPAGTAPGAGFLVRAKIANGGTKSWSGGWFRPAWRIRVDFETPDGKPIDAVRISREEFNPLPIGGIAAGESVELALLAVAPNQAGPYKPVIRFVSALGELPDRGVVHRHPTTVPVGK